MNKSIQHLCVTIDNPDHPYYVFGTLDRKYFTPEVQKQGYITYCHNEEGPFAILKETEDPSNYEKEAYALFNKRITKQEWEKKLHEMRFNAKFEDLIK